MSNFGKIFRVLCYSIIVVQIYQLQASEPQNQKTIEGSAMDTVDWPGLLADLRGNWQSPLSYLQKRGYLPPVNENLLEQKLNELRAIKVSESKENSNCDLNSEANFENNGAETSGSATSFSGKTAIDIMPLSILSASNLDILNSAEGINPSSAIVTYASQQQKSQESIDNLLKDLSNDVLIQPNADAEADSEYDEDSDSFRNSIANANVRKPLTGGSKSKPKHKCKPKSKSQQTSKSKPGFFQRLKQKLSSIFMRSKEVDLKKAPIEKPALSADYANYFVKYLAPRRELATGSNTLSVNDLNGQYAGINSCGDWERDGKGLYRRDHSASKLKDLTFGDLSGKKTAGSKDISLNMFPFKDFNLGDLSGKKLNIKDTSSQTDDTKNADLKNFNSKDEELNKIVHSLAEQQPIVKDMNSIKGGKSESKENINLNDLSFRKDSGSAPQDTSHFKDMDVKNLNLKESSPNIDEKIVDNAAKNTELPSYKDITANDIDMGDLKMSSFNIKNSESKSKADMQKSLNLNDIELSIPNLPDSSWKSSSVYSPSKDASAKDYGNLGMPSLKLKILESSAQQAAATAAAADVEVEDDSEQPTVNGVGITSNDYSVSAVNNFDMRRDMPNMSAKNSNENLSHVAAKETNLKNFEIGELSTKFDDNNLELDRQFTKQVLEKVMRSSAQNDERGQRKNCMIDAVEVK